jgi:hypothetical protein
MLGVHINPMLNFREHFAYITKDVRQLTESLAKRKLSPSYEIMVDKQLPKSKYHAVHMGVFNNRQLNSTYGLLNVAIRQATGLLPNFPTEGVQRPTKEASLGLPLTRDRVVHMGIEHLTNTMSRYFERGFTAYFYIHRIFTQFKH